MASAHDQNVLRRLAGEAREIAELPEMDVRRKRWLAHNALQPERPMVLCYPEGGWVEILTDQDFECEDATLRGFEHGLRQRLYCWHHLRDDQAHEPWFELSWIVDEGDFGVPKVMHQGENRGSYTWDAPIQDIIQAGKVLKQRKPSVDRQASLERFELAQNLFGDLLPVRWGGSYWWTLGMTWKVIDLLGIEPFMVAMMDEPDAVHCLMAWMRDEHLQFINWFEREGLLAVNNQNGYTGSGGVAYTNELPQSDHQPGQPARLKDLWGFAESQETSGISPSMFEEFILPYQIPLLENFGLNCYGCCEPLQGRWQTVKAIPRLRRVSVSPWCDLEFMADALKRDFIFSRKPNPAPICVGFDEATIRADLKHTVEVAGDCVLELILKDTHTLENDPSRLTRWIDLAFEAVGGR